MTRARTEQVNISHTPYYHIISRCVRRSYLCGKDTNTGKCYEHRRQWIENRIRILSSIFSVDICAYSVMSNHMHIVVKLCPNQIEQLSNEKVLERWCSLFKGPILVQKHRKGETLSEIEQQSVDDCIQQYRKRLSSLSWFMKCLNEPIARQANKEDGCTGHFWEARYKSQALLTEEALISCMAYVDLNPIRAAMAETPETSDHTSIKERINPQFDLSSAVMEQIQLDALIQFNLPLKALSDFEGTISHNSQSGILFCQKDYLQLIDYTGRCVCMEKRGFIPKNQPPILQRLNIETQTWLNNATSFGKIYKQKFSRCAKIQTKSG